MYQVLSTESIETNTKRVCETYGLKQYPQLPTKNQTLAKKQLVKPCHALRGNRTPGGSMATTQVTTTPLMLQHVPLSGHLSGRIHKTTPSSTSFTTASRDSLLRRLCHCYGSKPSRLPVVRALIMVASPVSDPW